MADINDIRIQKDRSRPASVTSHMKWKNPVRKSH